MRESRFQNVDPGKIVVMKQPRRLFPDADQKTLAESLRDLGQMQTCGVLPVGDGRFRLVWGERRYRECKKAGEKVPCLILPTGATAEHIFRLQLAENFHRTGLTPFEEAEAVGRGTDEFGWSADACMKHFGRSRTWVEDRLLILGLPGEIRDRLEQGELAVTHVVMVAKAIKDTRRAEWIRLVRSLDHNGVWTSQSVEAAVRAFARDNGKEAPARCGRPVKGDPLDALDNRAASVHILLERDFDEAFISSLNAEDRARLRKIVHHLMKEAAGVLTMLTTKSRRKRAA